MLLLISCNGCSGLTKVTDAITNPSAREVYGREFKDNQQLLAGWEAAFTTAKADSLLVPLPYGEKGTFVKGSNRAYSYIVALQEGEVLQAGVLPDSLNHRVFIDVGYVNDSVYTHEQSSKAGERDVEFIVKQTGNYKVIIQPELNAETNFFISLTKRPLYGFPVAGKGNADIMSFWGMERDAGARRHEGIDIFAKKGTPVVAITEGTIGYTGERGLGGKQVWLRSGLFGNSLYYAHLDSIAVQTGAGVKPGDTLGFVGNTGNAKFTPPHLHFGIYKNGAVNPLPFVYTTPKITQSQYSLHFNTPGVMVKNNANLRQGPATTNAVVGVLNAKDTVMLLGQHKDWLHIQTPAGQKAFLYKSLATAVK